MIVVILVIIKHLQRPDPSICALLLPSWVLRNSTWYIYSHFTVGETKVKRGFKLTYLGSYLMVNSRSQHLDIGLLGSKISMNFIMSQKLSEPRILREKTILKSK